ncbi:similar to ictalurid herpesvirus 1 ORF 48 encoded by GenBank Accession Number M75136 [Salmonid herpesvirus 1]|uniref:ORF 48 protein n=1 Tax=Salmonid herpesvirus 1 TaxID=67604 RepID=O38019_9VIRU|nr:similar to ictalurid herpesvirus 1 ORF 48 encoded by GenBank Accession Number M75136 [Salmonid herpesvirus 1]AAC59318.1 similar to ictalurid herpesvirus 1 ORF 48 encoded by GenBank Accession Number M75136 [Salmonid herpesvirus 1]UNP64369.1 hypothetical protein [Salmonid herpesvirus 1]
MDWGNVDDGYDFDEDYDENIPVPYTNAHDASNGACSTGQNITPMWEELISKQCTVKKTTPKSKAKTKTPKVPVGQKRMSEFFVTTAIPPPKVVRAAVTLSEKAGIFSGHIPAMVASLDKLMVEIGDGILRQNFKVHPSWWGYCAHIESVPALEQLLRKVVRAPDAMFMLLFLQRPMSETKTWLLTMSPEWSPEEIAQLTTGISTACAIDSIAPSEVCWSSCGTVMVPHNLITLGGGRVRYEKEWWLFWKTTHVYMCNNLLDPFDEKKPVMVIVGCKKTRVPAGIIPCASTSDMGPIRALERNWADILLVESPNARYVL